MPRVHGMDDLRSPDYPLTDPVASRALNRLESAMQERTTRITGIVTPATINSSGVALRPCRASMPAIKVLIEMNLEDVAASHLRSPVIRLL